ncbi:uncharacterized protein LOC118693118 isoform X1 [Molothrus ater]|uniref:uncharacterized protein LOC118693118 isoform X1 n=1 Tax=Molothrus ater TaxID=84834 RepID=UPI0023E7FCEA|nr:uncharacterized protein LOC118693118 isoform X1 [Molothrus ater]
MAELAGRRAGCARGGSPVPREEEPGWAQPPGSRLRPGRCSSSSSVCTEDFAASFWEAMVEPLLCQQEPAGDVPRAGAHPGQDEPLFLARRSSDTAMGAGRAPRQDSSASRSSLESLGASISRLSLSQSHGEVPWGVPWPGPPAQPALGHGDRARGELLGTAGHPWIAAGIAAGRSRPGARTGAPGSSAPRASRATTRGHPALGPPPALWGHGRNVTFSVAAMDTEGAASSRSAGTAVGAPQTWRSPVSPGLRGDKKGELPCKGLAGQPLRRSHEGTRELGSGARPWSQGDRDRTGLALLGHTRDTRHRCHTDLQSVSWQGQGARVGQEQLDKERRKITTLQEEKLELLERLRELERGSCSLLRQRLRVLHRLQGLLQRDRAQSLRLLREAMEQELPGSSARREHRPSRAGGSAALGNPPVAPRGHGPRPGTALAPGPSPAALGRALHVLRGLRQQIQRRLGQWQSLEGALGAAGQRKEVIWGWEGGHGVRDRISPWRSPHCHPRGNGSPSAGRGASRVCVPVQEGQQRQQPQKAPGAPVGGSP